MGGVGTQKNPGEGSHGPDPDRTRISYIKLFNIGGATHGHASRIRHVEETSVHDRPAEKLPDDRHNRNRNQISLRKRAATMREVISTVCESSLLRFGSPNDKISFPNSISGSQQPRKMPPGISITADR